MVTFEENKKKALDLIKTHRYDLDGMELLFQLTGELLSVKDAEDFNGNAFSNINRYIMRELNYAMAKLGMNDKTEDTNIYFNQTYINNCHQLMTAILQASLAGDPHANNSRCLALHDYLSPYSDKIKNGLSRHEDGSKKA